MLKRPKLIRKAAVPVLRRFGDLVARVVGSSVARFGLATAENFTRCWYIVAVVLISAFILVGTEQGREAILATAELPSSRSFVDFSTVFIETAAAVGALSLLVYLATVFSNFLIAQSRPAVADPADLYAAYHSPALIGLFAWFVPAILFQQHGSFIAPAVSMPAAARLLFGLPPALIILYARDYARFQTYLEYWKRTHEVLRSRPANPRARHALSRLRATILAFCAIALIAVVASLAVNRLLILAIFYWLGFLVADYFLYSSSKPPRTAWAVVAALAAVVLGWSMSSTTRIQGVVADIFPFINWIVLHTVDWIRPNWLSATDFDWIYAPYLQVLSFLSGSAAAFLFSIDFWLGLGFVITWLSWRIHWSRDRQVAAFFIFLIFAWRFFTGPFNIEDVRLLDTAPKAPAAEDIVVHAGKWLEARRAKIAAVDKYPVFIVNSDGGGIRAAYWTAALLAALQDRDPTFADHVFAISSVSGGSLGAALFAAMVKVSDQTKKSPCADYFEFYRQQNFADLRWQACAFVALHRDFLASPLAAMLVPDLARNILPVDAPDDRAAALEKSFEASWYWVSKRKTFSNDFADLWDGAAALQVPALLLNSTDATSGKRMVLSNVRLTPQADRIDLGAVLGSRHLRLSTAVLLSARFPAISPAGWLPEGNDPRRGYLIVDGGYVDNSGTLTATEALNALTVAIAPDKSLLDRIVPVALMISNDPAPQGPADAASTAAAPDSFSRSLMGSLITPVETLDSIRQTQTISLKRQYAETIRKHNGLVFDDLRLHSGDTQFPLGWTLAPGTMEAMDRQIAGMAANPASDFARTLLLLSNSR